MSDNATANKPAAWRVDVEGIGSIMPICRDWVEVQGICNRFGDRVFGVAPLYEETKTLPAAWISVSERLPDVQVNVLLSRPPEHRQSRLRIMRLIDQGYEQYWADDIGDTSPINSYSHWMPLPEPPEVE